MQQLSFDLTANHFIGSHFPMGDFRGMGAMGALPGLDAINNMNGGLAEMSMPNMPSMPSMQRYGAPQRPGMT